MLTQFSQSGGLECLSMKEVGCVFLPDFQDIPHYANSLAAMTVTRMFLSHLAGTHEAPRLKIILKGGQVTALHSVKRRLASLKSATVTGPSRDSLLLL